MGKMGSAAAWGLLGRRHLEMVFLSFDKEKGAHSFALPEIWPIPKWMCPSRDSSLGKKCRGSEKFGICSVVIPPGQLFLSWEQVMDHVQPFLVSPQGTSCALESCQAAAPWELAFWLQGEPGPAPGTLHGRVWPCSDVLRPQSHPNFSPGAAPGDAGLRLR